MQRLRADEHRHVRALAVQQRHHAVLGQLGLPAVADGDFRGALHVHAAVVGGEGVAGQALHRAARLHAADL